MKNILLILFLFIQPAFLFSQDKIVPIKLEKGEELDNSIDFGENGFILQTNTAGLYKKAQHILRRYDKDLNLKWELKIEGKGQKSFQGPQGYNAPPDLLSNEKGDFFYLVEDLPEQLKNRIAITKISNDGKIEEEYVIEKYKKIFEVIQHIFLYNDKLYIIGSSDHYYNFGLINEKKGQTLLAYIDVKNKKMQVNTLKLPELENPKISSYWYFKEIYNDQLIMVSQELPKSQKKGSALYHILSLDFKGNTTKQTKIDLPFGETFILPSSNRILNLNDSKTSSIQQDIQSFAYTSGSGDTSVKQLANVGAYSELYVDKTTGEILIFGLLGEKEAVGQGSKMFFNEIFINCYSYDGKLKWDKRIPKPVSLLDPKFPHFLAHNLILNKEKDKINLQLGLVTTKSKFNLSKAIFSADILTMSISKTGEILNQKEDKFTEFAKGLSNGKSFGLVNVYLFINSSLFKSCLYGNPNGNFIKYAITEDKPMYDIEKIINPSESGETLFIYGKKSYELHYYKRKMN
ncbi:hypothetical protein [Flexithrix dorotheae]|uniref:hypothetical protein n=1 Tax=Flexithrix dorotheae TaxID=70993 RepID=UPI000368D97F|nr:hypothetical protein [Flexithrix dorotheae]